MSDSIVFSKNSLEFRDISDNKINSIQCDASGNLDISGGTLITQDISATDISCTRLNVADNLVVTAAGNVGIGTTSPEASLDIKGSGTFPTFTSQGIRMGLNGVFRGSETAAAYSQDLAFIAPSSISVGYMSSIWFASANRSLQSTTAADGWIRYKHSNSGSLFIGVNGQDRIRITSNGNVGIGTTGPTDKLHIAGVTTPAVSSLYIDHTLSNGAGTSGSQHTVALHVKGRVDGGNTTYRRNTASIRVDSGNGNGVVAINAPHGAYGASSVAIDCYNNSNTRIFYVDRNGNVGRSGSDNFSSDDRLKHNENDISNALITINKLKPQFYIKTYNVKDSCGNEYSSNHNFTENDLSNGLPEDTYYDSGYIAQDISNIAELNHLVSGSEYDASGNPTPLALNYTGIQPYLTKAVQELSVLNDEKTAQIASMQTTITDLQTEIQNIKTQLQIQ